MAWTLRLLVAPLILLVMLMPSVSGQLPDGEQTLSLTMLPYFTLRSLARMFVALALSVVFGLFYGIAAVRSSKAERFLIPILDVLQSIPILGFFPAAIYIFVALFQGGEIGVEVAAVFLIFTSMAWNLAFSVYESVSTIPADLQEAAGAFGLRGWAHFRRALLPACVPKLVYNAMMSWAAGWYFLVAAETITIGSKLYGLPGLGSFLAESTYSGRFANAIIAFGLLVALILLIDLIVWRPLEAHATRFKYDTVGEAEAIHRGRSYASRLAGVLTRFPAPTGHLLAVAKSVPPIVTHGFLALGRSYERLRPRLHAAVDRRLRVGLFSFAFAAALVFGYFLVELMAARGPVLASSMYGLLTDANLVRNAALIPAAIGSSMLRLTVAYTISLAWTLLIAVKIARSKRAFSVLMPVFQTLASVPATAYFPFLVVLVIGLPAGVEFASILLVLTGMQWYLLFNLIAGARSVPADMEEAARAFGLHGKAYIRKVVLPSLYPSLLTGSITGWGGGWNALIVSEYIVFGATTYRVFGIGAMLNAAAYELGSMALLLLSVVGLSATVIIVNRIFWRRLYRHVTARYRMEY